MIEAKLKKLNITIPTPTPPAADYVPFVKVGSLVFISGQLPLSQGEITYKGKVGDTMSLKDGQEAARLCALNILAQLKEACEGDLNRIQRCIRLGGFVNSTDTFTEHPKVINGASDLMVAIFGDKGKHTRVALGVNALPLGAVVEVEAIFEVNNS